MILKNLFPLLSSTLLLWTTHTHAKTTSTTKTTTTTVAVLEFGTGGTVRRTTSTNTQASTHDVSSFWANLHNMDPFGRRPKSVQPAGMNMVPDFFKKPNGGLMVGLSFVGGSSSISSSSSSSSESDSIETMLENLEDTSNPIQENVVGYFDVKGSQVKSLLKYAHDAETFHSEDFGKRLDQSVKQMVSSLSSSSSSSSSKSSSSMDENNKVQTVSLRVFDKTQDENVFVNVNQQLSNMMDTLKKEAEATDSTFVVHLVMEHENPRKQMINTENHPNNDEQSVIEEEEQHNHRRRLEEYFVEYEEEVEDVNKGSIYYGYGYVDKFGNWYTPYRTISQMQYFQVTLWSALGLFGLLVFSMGKMINMHLMPDTLLFGESAKMSGE